MVWVAAGHLGARGYVGTRSGGAGYGRATAVTAECGLSSASEQTYLDLYLCLDCWILDPTDCTTNDIHAGPFQGKQPRCPTFRQRNFNVPQFPDNPFLIQMVAFV